jgi:hypothetical protein
MQTTIELQPKREQHLARWKQLGADRELAKLPYKIETDRFGRILMSPPPFSITSAVSQRYLSYCTLTCMRAKCSPRPQS